jgi:hypothetical protein
VAHALPARSLPLNANRRRPPAAALDLGRALSHIRGCDRQAVAALAEAETTAPQYVRAQPMARNVVSVLIGRTRNRATADELRRLADRTGLGSV